MKKISMFFTAVISLACIFVFSSCGKKDEIDLRIVDVKAKGTVQFILRGYSIGTTGISYLPESVRKNEYQPLGGIKITLANGQILTTDENGKATVSLETGVYIIDKINIPTGYYYNYNCIGDYDYETDTYTYTYVLPENDDDYPYYEYNSFSVHSGYQENLIRVYKK